MSDDLISRKALMKEIHDFAEAHRSDDEVSWTGLDWLLKEDDVVAMISNIPTAYDVDKVVEQIKSIAIGIPTVRGINMVVEVGTAANIVKGGGMDE